MKKALITGITGQDGSYLAELLLGEGYDVYGLVRRTSGWLPPVIEDLYVNKKITLIDGNLRDLETVRHAVEVATPDEVYNLAAQSHVAISFNCPDETWEINYYGVGRIVNEAMRVNSKVRVYQASTSEMFGSTPPPQNESSPMNPVSPYAQAKLKAHEDFIRGYRDKHNLFASSGILFNHESPRRGKNFVTRKITRVLAGIKLGRFETLELGNLAARRDWGFAGDYIQAMHQMLLQDAPDDYVIGTGTARSVKDFVEAAANSLDMPLAWEGEGVNEVGRATSGKVVVTVNKDFYRPNEVDHLIADASKAKAKLGWAPTTSFEQLVKMMTEADYNDLQRNP
jgi:GDPmannose 4,6-dehydratase